MDHYGYRYLTNRDVNGRLEKIGSKGEEHNMIMSLTFNRTKCFRGSYRKKFVGKVRGFVSI